MIEIKNEILNKMLNAPYWLSKLFLYIFSIAKKRSGRSLVFSRVAPRETPRKRQYVVKDTPDKYPETQPLSEMERI